MIPDEGFRQLIDFCERQNDSSLQQNVQFVLSTGQPFSERIVDVLQHVFAHQIHHRGQVHDMLSQTETAPPQLDEFFMRGDLDLRAGELAQLSLPIE